MATGGASADGGTEDPIVFTCPICLDALNEPRFLPCYHTYCTKCIQNMADAHTGRAFPCPSCRKPTRLPPGGVQSLQVNYYVTTRPIKRARRATPEDLKCETHQDETLRFYCVQCRTAICRDCKLTKHEVHKTDDLSAAEKKIKKKMITAKEYFREQVHRHNQHLDVLQRSKEDAMAKKELLVRSIQDRHDTLVAAADKARDEGLQSLDKVMKEVEDEYDAETEKLVTSATFENAQDSNTKLENVNYTSVVGVLELASSMGMNVELDEGEFQEELQRRFPTSKTCKMWSVVQRFSDEKVCSIDSLVQRSRDFVGSVVKTELTASTAEEYEEYQVQVLERFACAQEMNTRVFSLCHCDGELPELRVSYDQCGLDTNAPVKLFSETGELTGTSTKTGRVNYKRYVKGQLMCLHPSQGWICTFTKSLNAGHYRLDNNSSGKATMFSEKVTSTEPFQTERKEEFQITVGPHRAVDVDHTETQFVVLEEPQPPHEFRQVHLYHRGAETPVSTYTSPIQPFQPSDVCFYTLGGQRVLLIADEANDAIHVVNVRHWKFQFERYLAPGCPHLLQPTALNVDIKGRLWVACRGGKIITMEPKD